MTRDYRYFPPHPALYTGKKITAVWFDEFGPRIEFGPAIKEEESRMKQIDFAKPLRLNYNGQGNEVEVVKEGVTLVRIKGSLFAVDEHGVIQQTGSPREGVQSFRVENVPEPKRDHLHLFRRANGEWTVDGAPQLMTKEYAEALSRGWARHAGAKNTVVVKVEV